MFKLGKWFFGLVLIISLAACGGNGETASSTNSGTADIEVSGELNFTLDDSARKDFRQIGMDEGTIIWQFQFSNGDQQVVVMFYGDEPTTGEYEITANGPLEGGIGVLVSDNSGEDPVIFTSGATGTISTEQDGELYSGTFEFSIPDPTNSAATAIEASGSFSGLEMELYE